MRVYVACPWKHKHEAISAAILLRVKGYEISSRWHDLISDGKESDGSDTHPDICRQEAVHDVADVISSDVVLVLNIEKSEGKAVEQGIAIAHGIPIIVIGTRSNVFQYLPTVRVVSTLVEASRLLASLALSAQSAPSDSK